MLCTSGFVDDVTFSDNGPLARHIWHISDDKHNNRDSNQILLNQRCLMSERAYNSIVDRRLRPRAAF